MHDSEQSLKFSRLYPVILLYDLCEYYDDFPTFENHNLLLMRILQSILYVMYHVVQNVLRNFCKHASIPMARPSLGAINSTW